MYGIDGDALQWLRSYLGRRRQRVVLNGKVSEWVPVLSGTPEGGHISPLLFSLYVNDLPTAISTNCLLFADDLKLFHEIRSDEDVHALQRDLDAVTRWAADWKLKLNASKCKSFKITLKRKIIDSSYSINSTTLENVTSIRDLGVILDQKLDFADQVNSVVKKANTLWIKANTFSNKERLDSLFEPSSRPPPGVIWTSRRCLQPITPMFGPSSNTAQWYGVERPNVISFGWRGCSTSFWCGWHGTLWMTAHRLRTLICCHHFMCRT